MKKQVSLLVAAALIGCADTATSPIAPDIEPAFAATATTSSTKIPFQLVVFVPCADDGAGEFVQLDGELHILVHTTIDDNGGIHLKSHFQPQGFGGVGLTTGDRYRGVGVTQDALTVHPGGFPATSTFVNNFRMIGQGPGNNFQVHQNVHMTVNANGDVTANVNNSSTTCG
jgi:hypothetical protein